ncbi:MAG: GntR family transcriptional regulator [Planctomycetes bacterium]|nr:GntR family transcriptional regulator [Planctomycetota bacterium]
MAAYRKLDSSNKSIPSYIQLKQILAADIADSDKEFRLPSIRQLMKRHKVSQTTVEKALFELESEGLIRRGGTMGNYAVPYKEKPDVAPTSGDGGLVGILVHDQINFFPKIVRAAKEHLSRKNYYPLVYSSGNNRESVDAFVDILKQNHAAGAIVVPRVWCRESLDALSESEIPFVFATEDLDGFDVDCVRCDDQFGFRIATEHLLDLGHKNIGIFLSEGDIATARRDAYMQTLADRGVKFNPSLCCMQKAGVNIKRVLEMKEKHDITAVILNNDVWAVELYWMLLGAGIKVPDDLSIVGFDDSEISKVSKIQLTTVAQPLAEIGRTAADRLIDVMSGSETRPGKVILKPELVVRETTRALDVAAKV